MSDCYGHRCGESQWLNQERKFKCREFLLADFLCTGGQSDSVAAPRAAPETMSSTRTTRLVHMSSSLVVAMSMRSPLGADTFLIVSQRDQRRACGAVTFRQCAILASNSSALDAGRLHTMCSTLVVTVFMSSTCSPSVSGGRRNSVTAPRAAPEAMSSTHASCLLSLDYSCPGKIPVVKGRLVHVLG